MGGEAGSGGRQRDGQVDAGGVALYSAQVMAGQSVRSRINSG